MTKTERARNAKAKAEFLVDQGRISEAINAYRNIVDEFLLSTARKKKKTTDRHM